MRGFETMITTVNVFMIHDIKNAAPVLDHPLAGTLTTRETGTTAGVPPRHPLVGGYARDLPLEETGVVTMMLNTQIMSGIDIPIGEERRNL